MPALAASAVTVLDTWVEGGPNGKRHVCKRLTLNLVAQGGPTNNISAAVLGFAKMLDCSTACDAALGDIYIAAVSPDGLFLLFNDPSNAANTPADQTDVVTLTVRGIA